MGKAVIRMGDPTSHGGHVTGAFSNLMVYGKAAAGIGHPGYCPLCKTTFTIVAGAGNYSFMGKNVAVEGMQTSCGATLIATQHQFTVDDKPGENIVMTSLATMGNTGGSAQEFNDKYIIKGHDGTPLANTEYALSVDGGEPEHGVTDASGHTHLLASVAEQHHIDIYLEG